MKPKAMYPNINKNNKMFKCIILFCFFLMPIYVFLSFSMATNSLKVQYCLSDMYCFADVRCKWILLTISLLFIIYLLKSDFRMSVIVRHLTIRRMWIKLCIKIAKVSFAIAAYMYIVVTIIGLNFGQIECNWTSRDCYGFRRVGLERFENPSVWEIMLIYFLITLLTVFIAGLSMTILWWWFNSPIVGFMALLSIYVFEMSSSPI